jgi:adenylate cyclase
VRKEAGLRAQEALVPRQGLLVVAHREPGEEVDLHGPTLPVRSIPLTWGSDVAESTASFVFADIAGFTALTEAHGDEEALALVERFSDVVGAQLPAVGGEHVKTIGDALMLRVPEPGPAIRLGLRITRGALGHHGSPDVRVGLHHGTAVERRGDYFGAAVNLAARVSALAAGGEVLVSGPTAALVPDLEGVVYESRGRHVLRNVREPVEIFAALEVGTAADRLPVDPVCRMAVDPERAPGRLLHDGTVYFFCCLNCAGEFAREPERFVDDD